MIIGDKDTSKKPYVIAEAGTSHRGKVRLALRLVKAAHRAGADAIKFQMFTPREELFCPMEGDENRWAWWNESMLKFSEWKRVKEYADELGIHFLASVFQKTGVEWLKALDPVVWKVASRAAGTFPYDELSGPFLISNGFGWPPDMRGYRFLVLGCEPAYPTTLLKAAWDSNATDGLSDHSGTIYPSLDAMARGAQVIEVHFSLRPDDAGPDYEVCLTPAELKLICECRDGFTEMRAH